MGAGVKNIKKSTLLSANFLFKLTLMGAKFCENGTFKRPFWTKFDFSVLTFVKIVKMQLLWVQKSVKPYPYRCFQGLQNPILMGAIFFFNHGLSKGTSADTEVLNNPLPPGH